MSRALALAYELAARAAESVAALAPTTARSKIVASFAARRNLLPRFAEWGRAGRDRTRPLIWLHAASLGESLMAQPLIDRIRRSLPQAQIAFTFYSPSAEPFARSLGADFADYLPFDSRHAARTTLDALAPSALVFVKSDVWPALTLEAARRGIPVALVSGSMPDDSARANGLGAAITRDAYRALDAVGAASDGDARALVRAGARVECVTVTGDTRYDQAWRRAHEAPRNRELVERLHADRKTLVAGSTWASDERELLPAWLRARAGARMIIAAHEPSAAHTVRLLAWASASGLTASKIDSARDEDVIIVDHVGLLADLYALADVAYVGGGFHDAGLHSLVEPAMFRVPAIVGPRIERSRDARVMLAAGGIVSAEDSASLERAITRLLTDFDARTSMSDALGFVVTSELGAAARSFEIVRGLLRPVEQKSLNEMHTE